jgi:hypothetical protein
MIPFPQISVSLSQLDNRYVTLAWPNCKRSSSLLVGVDNAREGWGLEVRIDVVDVDKIAPVVRAAFAFWKKSDRERLLL